MRRIRIACIASAALLLSACSVPTSSVTSGSQRPTLAVTGAPPQSILKIDGTIVGEASLYDGRQNIVKVEEGTHRIVVELNGVVIHSETIYASSGETKTVEIGSSKK
jgi:hypothetical protein